MNDSTSVGDAPLVDGRARAFVDARLSAGSLPSYPGTKPETIDEAYKVQDSAISIWPDAIVGWKAGRIPEPWASDLNQDRLVGPVFDARNHDFSRETLDMPVFASGFAAVEGEVVAVIAEDAANNKTTYSTADALDMVESVHVGVEVASSPFSEINDHGPLVTISDLGNNYGLILGQQIKDWRDFALADWSFETQINGRVVGSATPESMPGGPLESVRFILENTARRGLFLKKGMRLLTGAVTGVHPARSGDSAQVTMRGTQPMKVRLVATQPVDRQRRPEPPEKA